MLLRPGHLPKSTQAAVPLLHNGDLLSQSEFHQRYEQYPDETKFELINGMVFMASPERLPHGSFSFMLVTALGTYQAETPGVGGADGATVILGDESEPQPDILLRIMTEYGGRTTKDDEGYLTGPPELVIEIAHSTVAIDLHIKKDDYRRNRVTEYIVVCIGEQQVHWFDLTNDKTRKLDPDGVLRSKMFPGLWIDTGALFREELNVLLKGVRNGLDSPQHARFVRRLAKAAETKAKSKKRPRKNGA